MYLYIKKEEECTNLELQKRGRSAWLIEGPRFAQNHSLSLIIYNLLQHSDQLSFREARDPHRHGLIKNQKKKKKKNNNNNKVEGIYKMNNRI